MTYTEKYREFCSFLIAQGFDLNDYTEFKFEAIYQEGSKYSMSDLIAWYEKLATETTMQTQRIPLDACIGWKFDETGSFVHESGEFFRVEGYRISGTNSREVTAGWDQPFLTQVGFDGGILGLLRKRFNGQPHYLVEAKEEPGNYRTVQLSTTVQATFSNLKRAHKGKKTNFSELFLDAESYPVRVIFDQWTSEDGGRLFNKRNRTMLIEHDEHIVLDVTSERYKWLTLFQIKKLIRERNAIVAPHLRGVFSGL